ncbi:MAG TPA: HAD family phosphatase [Thermomicrobiales bacterium]|nr:HAD family phosphatase [Thermomicrobiales bacterium]
MISAVMFDMDGVLVDSEPAHFAVTVDALAAQGLPVPDDHDWERVFLGRPDVDGFAEWFLEHRISVDLDVLMADKLGRFMTRFAELVTPFNDGQWLARALFKRGVRLALVTGARRAEADMILRSSRLSDAFEATISADDVTRGKPDPEPYLMGAAALGVSARDCLVIEDAVVGLRAAEAAGASVIVVDRLHRPERFVSTQPVTRLDAAVLRDILARRQPD